jgi:folate-binding protein YgfZ
MGNEPMTSTDEYDALQERAGLLNRQSRGRLQLTGADRRSYLHGLLTNDIVALSPGHGCYAALLTPQGRMISDMRVSELGEDVLVDLPASVAGIVRQRLADFIFSEDVDVQDVQSTLTHLAVYGRKAGDVLSDVLTRPMANDDREARRARLDAMIMNANSQWRFHGGAEGAADGSGLPVIVVRSDDFGIAGFELFIEAAHAQELADAVRKAGAQDVSAETVDVTRVEAGRPEFGTDMDEHTIPLEAGIEDRAISLSKGCYVGQEIIIRVLHRGHGRVARRLVGFVADSSGRAPVRGDRFLAEGKDVGGVTSTVVSPRVRRPIGLGYVHRDHAEPGKVLQLATADDTRRSVTIVTLPFTPQAAG